jgi:hypothetical protein
MSVLGVGQFTIIDFSDINISNNPSDNPGLNQLWLDSSITPPILKRWAGVNWQIIGPMSLEELDPEKLVELNELINDVERMNSEITTIQNETTDEAIIHKVTTSDVFQQYTFMQNVVHLNFTRQGSVINPLNSYNPIDIQAINEDTIVKFDFNADMKEHFVDTEVLEVLGSNTITNDKLTDRVKSTELKITDDAIISTVTKSEVYKTAIGGIENRLSSAEEKITADAIVDTVTTSEKYTTDMGGLDTRLKTAEQKITDDSIVSTVRNSEEYMGDLAGLNTDIEGLNTRLQTAEQKITPDAIVSTVTESQDFIDLDDRIASAEQKITPDAIVNTVTNSETYRLDTLMPLCFPIEIQRQSKVFSPLDGYNAIGETLFNENEPVTGVTEIAMLSSIDLDLQIVGNNISLMQRAGERIKSAELKITDNAIVSTVRSSQEYIGDMGSKVGVTELVSMINQSAAEILLYAQNITLQGEVTLSDLLNPNDQTKIIGSSIYGGAITLGGGSNGNGVLSIIDNNNTEIIKADNTGIAITKGIFRIGESDTNFKMKFDGADLLFGSGAIKWVNLDNTTKTNIGAVSVMITGGARSFVFNPNGICETTATAYGVSVVQNGTNVSPTSVAWSYGGFLSGNTSTPIVGTWSSYDTWVQVSVVVNGATYTQRAPISGSKNGADGIIGSDAKTYWLVTDTSVINKNINGFCIPQQIVVTGKCQTGDNSPIDSLARFIIAESPEGVYWSDKYTSSTNETSVTYTPSSNVKSIRVRMYLAGGTTILLDEQSIPVIADGRNGTNGTNGLSAITALLTNESCTVPADSDGNVISFANASTKMKIYFGIKEDTANWAFWISAESPGVGGTISSNTYTLTTMSSNYASGYVDIMASQTGFSSITKRFSISKAFQGIPGPAGPILPWITDWDGNTTQINGASIISPKIFSGTTNTLGQITGVAIGRNVLVDDDTQIGIVAYQNNQPTFQVKSNGTVIIGKSGKDQITLDSNGNAVIPNITANHIVGGTLTLGGPSNVNGVLVLKENWFNDTTGKFEIRDIITMDTGGMLIDHGKLTVNDGAGTTIIDRDGIHADSIYTGYMSFDRAKGGTLSLGGYNNYNGLFSLRTSNWDSEINDEVDVYEIIKMDHTGMYINGGSKFRIGVSNTDYQMYFDGANLHFGADVSISWENLDTTGATAGDVGARPYDWLPEYGDIQGIKPPADADNTTSTIGEKRLTSIDLGGIYTGTLTAQQINAVQGIVLGATATINWATVNKPTAEDIGARPDDWLPTCLDIGAMAKATYIDGNNVFTGNIYCDHISSSNKNSIIKLFDNDGDGIIYLYDGNGNSIKDEYGNPKFVVAAPAIDATYDMNAGVGSAIRLKWDNKNYIYVTKGQIRFYVEDDAGNSASRFQITKDGPANMTVYAVFS